MTTAEFASDSYRCWELAIACLRENGVRRGDYAPVNERERRQAAEGPVDHPSRLWSIQSGDNAA